MIDSEYYTIIISKYTIIIFLDRNDTNIITYESRAGGTYE